MNGFTRLSVLILSLILMVFSLGVMGTEGPTPQVEITHKAPKWEDILKDQKGAKAKNGVLSYEMAQGSKLKIEYDPKTPATIRIKDFKINAEDKGMQILADKLGDKNLSGLHKRAILMLLSMEWESKKVNSLQCGHFEIKGFTVRKEFVEYELAWCPKMTPPGVAIAYDANGEVVEVSECPEKK